jgi:hypothetical protein
MAETLYTDRLIIVVVASLQAQANSRAVEIDATGGLQTFTAGLSASGAAPATHYWCSWQLLPDERARLSQRMQSLGSGSKVRIYDGNTTTAAQVLAQTGLKEIVQ